jgi:hypothetical protein
MDRYSRGFVLPIRFAIQNESDGSAPNGLTARPARYSSGTAVSRAYER